MRTELVSAESVDALQRALDVLRRGGLVAFPTDTVYGVGSLAFEGAAVARIYAVKGRSEAQAVPVLLAELADLDRLASPVTPELRRLAAAFWPGALTLVVGKHPALPAAISASGTVGLRMPDHPLALELLRAAGPMAASSANRSGAASLTSAQQVMRALGGRIELVLDGGVSPGGRPSTVVDCTQRPPRLVREGPIALEAVVRCLEGG